MDKPTIIKGVNVNLDHEHVQAISNVEDIQKLEIFSHLSDDERQKAERELLSKLPAGKKKTAQSTEVEIVK